MRYWSLLLLCLFCVGCNWHEPVGVELTYAVHEDDIPSKKADMQKVLNAVQRRVSMKGTAELVGDRVKVGVFGSDQTNVDRVKDLLARAGVLEFRILADRRFDVKLIDLATGEEFAEQRDVRERSRDEFAVAQWCSIHKSESDRLAADKHLVTRKTKAGRVEALILMDPYHVTGDDFTEVYPATDQTGQSYVSFALSTDGARRMRRLTLENVPPADEPSKQRRMAIVLDGEVQSAPAIRNVIEDRAQITGKFSDQEVNDLCLVLSAGSLPVHLKFVDEAVVGNRAQ